MSIDETATDRKGAEDATSIVLLPKHFNIYFKLLKTLLLHKLISIQLFVVLFVN